MKTCHIGDSVRLPNFRRKLLFNPICALAVLGLLAGAPNQASAKVLYVSPTGKSSQCSKDKPCQFKEAREQVRSRDTVIFLSGTYKMDNSKPETRLSTTYDNVTYRSDKKWKAIITGIIGSPLATINHSDIKLSGFTFDGRRRASGIVVSASQGDVKNVKIYNNRIRNTLSAGIIVSGVRSKFVLYGIDIVDNRIQKTGTVHTGAGIIMDPPFAKSKISFSLIKNNRIRKFTDSCIRLGDRTQGIDIQDNKCYDKYENKKGHEQYGTIVLRGTHHDFRNNQIFNIRNSRQNKSNSIFSIAANGAIKVRKNTIKNVKNIKFAVHTREKGRLKPTTDDKCRGIASAVYENTFVNISRKRVQAKYCLTVRDNEGL